KQRPGWPLLGHMGKFEKRWLCSKTNLPAALVFNRAGIRYFFGTGGIGIRYSKIDHSVRYFGTFSQKEYRRYRYSVSVSVFREDEYFDSVNLKMTYRGRLRA
ncbi:MAG: hypothetical protein AAGJ80_04200, partial [Cyanobacteria bacterium J06553_1]